MVIVVYNNQHFTFSSNETILFGGRIDLQTQISCRVPTVTVER